MRIGFIGLGRMGSGMAAQLLAAGHELVVYNRSAAKAAPLAARGAQLAPTVADACRGDAVVTMLADDAALDAVTLGDAGILAHLAPDAPHVSMSTIGVAASERLAAAHAAAGRRFVAAPVFGRPDAAAAGALVVVAAGAAADLDACAPIFDAVGRRTFRVGEAPPAANLVKVSGNFLIASAIEALGEAIALVEKGGVDKRQYVELLTSTLFASPVYQTYGGLIAEERWEPAGFAAPLGLKDVRLALAAGDALRVPLPLASLLRDRFLELLARGGEHLDWSAIARLASDAAGR